MSQRLLFHAYAVTANQKKILNAFGLNENNVRGRVNDNKSFAWPLNLKFLEVKARTKLRKRISTRHLTVLTIGDTF
ncbi:MAG: hypothetical protein ACK5ML_03190 [Lachnospiraceae bacterium]